MSREPRRAHTARRRRSRLDGRVLCDAATLPSHAPAGGVFAATRLRHAPIGQHDRIPPQSGPPFGRVSEPDEPAGR